MGVRIIVGDVMDGLAQLADESVHCVVTSPPYWGLRDYHAEGQIGAERTVAEYIDRLVQVFREVHRVLRDDGTLWLNIGDAHTSGGRTWRAPDKKQRARAMNYRPDTPEGLKPKDLIGLPWRLAFALQADGWWLRQDVIWAKPNPMPESVTDRPTRSHEHIFLLSKSPRYYYDAKAIEEAAASGELKAGERAGRNARDVWRIAAEPFDGEFCMACRRYYTRTRKRQIKVEGKKRICQCGRHDAWLSHFATFPTKLVERCALAGTSAKGCCSECGAPWVREVERETVNRSNAAKAGTIIAGKGHVSSQVRENHDIRNGPTSITITTGWRPSCTCNADVVPAVVLDPFGGSGTTGLVADRLQRNAVLIELNPDYAEMARQRIEGDAGLLKQVALERLGEPKKTAA